MAADRLKGVNCLLRLLVPKQLKSLNFRDRRNEPYSHFTSVLTLVVCRCYKEQYFDLDFAMYLA